MRAWQSNVVSNGMLFDDYDVINAVNWAISKYDSIPENHEYAPQKRYKCHLLLDMILEAGGPQDDDVGRFTDNHWFKSMGMWLNMNMQTEINDFHNWINTFN